MILVVLVVLLVLALPLLVVVLLVVVLLVELQHLVEQHREDLLNSNTEDINEGY